MLWDHHFQPAFLGLGSNAFSKTCFKIRAAHQAVILWHHPQYYYAVCDLKVHLLASPVTFIFQLVRNLALKFSLSSWSIVDELATDTCPWQQNKRHHFTMSHVWKHFIFQWQGQEWRLKHQNCRVTATSSPALWISSHPPTEDTERPWSPLNVCSWGTFSEVLVLLTNQKYFSHSCRLFLF